MLLIVDEACDGASTRLLIAPWDRFEQASLGQGWSSATIAADRAAWLTTDNIPDPDDDQAVVLYATNSTVGTPKTLDRYLALNPDACLRNQVTAIRGLPPAPVVTSAALLSLGGDVAISVTAGWGVRRIQFAGDDHGPPP